MHPPLIIEVVGEHTLAVEANTIHLTLVTIEDVVEEEDIDTLEGIVRILLRNHNANYVANLVIQLKSATTDLIYHIRVLRAILRAVAALL